LSGLGGSAGGGAGAGDKPVVNQALDSIMGMAVQMPALKKLGDELGLSMEGGVAGLMSSDGSKPTNGAAPAQVTGPDGDTSDKPLN
jgi:hypothetical protein